MNLVIYLFSGFLLLMLMLGIPCATSKKWVPKVISDVYTYGKNNEGKAFNSFIQAILIPKSWFSHFYGFSALYMLLVLVILFSKFFLNVNPPVIISAYLNLVAYNNDSPLAKREVSLLAAFLFFTHVVRRFHETIYVNVFSSAKMNLVHYLAGILHYWGCCTVLLAYAIDYSDENTRKNAFLSIQTIIGILFFIFASYQQYVAHSTLANLRKDLKDKEHYALPQGGFFHYISCPNFFFEIIIYFSIYIILGFHHYPWALITTWVISNQVLAATMAQKWYRKKFETFPPSRKAIIPFIF